MFGNRQNTTDPPKAKRRSVPHNKHSAFPGLRLNTKEVNVQSGSIKQIKSRESFRIPEGKRISYSDPLWAKYDEFVRKYGDTNLHAVEGTHSMRNTYEFEAARAYQALVKEGKAQQIKFKYRGR